MRVFCATHLPGAGPPCCCVPPAYSDTKRALGLKKA